MYVLVRRREDAAPSPADQPVERTWVEKPAAVEPVADDYETRPIHRNPVVGLPRLEPALAAFAEPVSRRGPGVDQSAVDQSAVEQPVVEQPVVGRPVVEQDVVAEPVTAPETVGSAEPPLVAEAAPVAGAASAAEPVEAVEPAPVVETKRITEVEPTLVAEAESVAEARPVAANEPVAAAEPVEAPDTVGVAGYDRDGDSTPPLGEFEAPEPTVAAGTDIPELPPPAAPQPVEQTTWLEREDFRRRYLQTFEQVRRRADTN
ncbi:hypothetical protein [Lentzea sp.]|uniref:hypothetical protein n=1 Tax=Lentzea sp. TaxID=56099 RepID=UPI002ED130C4